MEKILALFSRLIVAVSGRASDTMSLEKIRFILQGAVVASIFIVVFFYLYYRYFWHNQMLRKLFWVCIGVNFFLISAKFVLSHFIASYITDRMLFFALPSPRIKSFGAVIVAILLFILFLKLRPKIEQLGRAWFAISLGLFFTVFSLTVAYIRDGVQGIIDPFTRIFWEYTGALPLVWKLGITRFISEYGQLIPQLPQHPGTHPPGYVVFLYSAQWLFHLGYLGLAVLIVLLSGATIGLLYYFWESIFSSHVARRMAEVLVFVPSLVFYSATSLEAFNFVIIWLTIVLCYFGWRKNIWLSFLGGIGAAYALFCNYLFVLLAPFFVIFLIIELRSAAEAMKRRVAIRIAASGFTFALSFALLRVFLHYSLIGNFFAGYEFYKSFAINNFESVGIYLSFVLLNLIPFIWHLGMPTVFYLVRDAKRTFIASNWWFKAGVIMWFCFVFIGLFQGEVERIWLFLMPFFLMYRSPLYTEANPEEFNAALSLIFFQIMIVQILFYTYW